LPEHLAHVASFVAHGKLRVRLPIVPMFPPALPTAQGRWTPTYIHKGELSISFKTERTFPYYVEQFEPKNLVPSYAPTELPILLYESFTYYDCAHTLSGNTVDRIDFRGYIILAGFWFSVRGTNRAIKRIILSAKFDKWIEWIECIEWTVSQTKHTFYLPAIDTSMYNQSGNPDDLLFINMRGTYEMSLEIHWDSVESTDTMGTVSILPEVFDIQVVQEGLAGLAFRG
jgi:hypothetical protein